MERKVSETYGKWYWTVNNLPRKAYMTRWQMFCEWVRRTRWSAR